MRACYYFKSYLSCVVVINFRNTASLLKCSSDLFVLVHWKLQLDGTGSEHNTKVTCGILIWYGTRAFSSGHKKRT
jgi:hypothetical protein